MQAALGSGMRTCGVAEELEADAVFWLLAQHKGLTHTQVELQMPAQALRFRPSLFHAKTPTTAHHCACRLTFQRS